MENSNPQPKKDTRVKTEDVTSTKGMTFQDFKLSEELQLVLIAYSFNHLSLNRASMRWDLSSPPQSKKKPSPPPY